MKNSELKHSHRIRKLPDDIAEYFVGRKCCAIWGCNDSPKYLARVQILASFGQSFPRRYSLCENHAKMFAEKYSLGVA